MATAGLDSMMKIWDLRMFKCLHSYKTDHPAMSLDISDRNLLAMAVGRSVHVLKDAFTKPNDLTYLKHTIRCPSASLSSGSGVTAQTRFLASTIATGSVRFRPFEDILAVGHTHGLSTIIVPGAYSKVQTFSLVFRIHYLSKIFFVSVVYFSHNCDTFQFIFFANSLPIFSTLHVTLAILCQHFCLI